MARGGRRRLGVPDDPDGNFAGGETQHIRSRVRSMLTDLIVRTSGDRRAKMWYTAAGFHSHVFRKRRLSLPTWPSNVPFRNPSDLRTAELRQLLDVLEDGTMQFRKVDDDEYYAHAHDIEGVAPGRFVCIGRLHSGRSDIKKSRFNKETGQPLSTRRKLRHGPKTPKFLKEVWVEIPPHPKHSSLRRT